MTETPASIDSLETLNEQLSRPSERLVDFIRGLDGDLMIVGASGKIGPSLAMTAQRAVEAAGVDKTVHAVARRPLPELAAAGLEIHSCEMLDQDAVRQLPKVPNIVYLIGRKFGSTGSESQTWAVNDIAAYHAARHFRGCRIAAFSTGCVYPVMNIATGGATEDTSLAPVGEYAMSCVGRERMFDYFADAGELDVAHIRLNYAVECRYGVLHDVATKVWNGEPVELTTGYANVIWQGDCNVQTLLALGSASHPSTALNITGPETFAIRWAAQRFAEIMGREALFSGEENGMGYLSNSAKANALFGYPRVALNTIVEWTARWVMAGGAELGKPTHFETQDGKY